MDRQNNDNSCKTTRQYQFWYTMLYIIAFLQGQAQPTLLFKQITRPCAIDLAYNNTVTFDKSTLDIEQVYFFALLADYIESIANIRTNTTAIEEALNNT